MLIPHRTLKFYGYLAIVVLLGTIVALLRPSPALSDTDLTGAVNAAFGPHVEDAALHDVAHQRVVEISAGFDPATGSAPNFNHSGMLTAEVLAWNMGATDPVAHAVEQWLGSPDHATLLYSMTLIGCAGLYVSGAYFAVCALANPTVTPTPAPVAPTEPPSGPFPLATPAATPHPISVSALPDTAAQP